jgi:hypothetical protein
LFIISCSVIFGVEELDAQALKAKDPASARLAIEYERCDFIGRFLSVAWREGGT